MEGSFGYQHISKCGHKKWEGQKVWHSSVSVAQSGVIFPPQGTSAMSGGVLDHHGWGVVILASHG